MSLFNCSEICKESLSMINVTVSIYCILCKMQFWIPCVVNCLWYYVFKIKVFENSNSSSFSSSSKIVQSSSWASSHYCHCCYDNKGANNIYRCKLKQSDGAIMGWCSPIPFKHLGALSTNGCGRLLHILILSGRRNACMLTFWYIGQGIVLCDLLRMQRKQGYCYKAIYNSVHHYSFTCVILTANGYHCSIFSK